MNDTNDQNLTGGVTPTPVDPMAQQATPAPTADAGTNPAPVAGIPQPIATDPTTVPEPSAIPVSEPPGSCIKKGKRQSYKETRFTFIYVAL